MRWGGTEKKTLFRFVCRASSLCLLTNATGWPVDTTQLYGRWSRRLTWRLDVFFSPVFVCAGFFRSHLSWADRIDPARNLVQEEGCLVGTLHPINVWRMSGLLEMFQVFCLWYTEFCFNTWCVCVVLWIRALCVMQVSWAKKLAKKK